MPNGPVSASRRCRGGVPACGVASPQARTTSPATSRSSPACSTTSLRAPPSSVSTTQDRPSLRIPTTRTGTGSRARARNALVRRFRARRVVTAAVSAAPTRAAAIPRSTRSNGRRTTATATASVTAPGPPTRTSTVTVWSRARAAVTVPGPKEGRTTASPRTSTGGRPGSAPSASSAASAVARTLVRRPENVNQPRMTAPPVRWTPTQASASSGTPTTTPIGRTTIADVAHGRRRNARAQYPSGRARRSIPGSSAGRCVASSVASSVASPVTQRSAPARRRRRSPAAAAPSAGAPSARRCAGRRG